MYFNNQYVCILALGWVTALPGAAISQEPFLGVFTDTTLGAHLERCTHLSEPWVLSVKWEQLHVLHIMCGRPVAQLLACCKDSANVYLHDCSYYLLPDSDILVGLLQICILNAEFMGWELRPKSVPLNPLYIFTMLATCSSATGLLKGQLTSPELPTVT